MALLVAAGAGGCADASADRGAPPAWMGAAYAPTVDGAMPSALALEAIGRSLFFDPALSASGTTSCASCHDPRFAYGPPNALSVQLAGADGATPGLRAAPTLRYLQTLPAFTEHFFDNDGDDSQDRGPTGGHTWDGRAGSAHAQVRLPLLSANEMANASPRDVAERLARGPHAAAIRRAFGEKVFDAPEKAFDAASLALEVFLQSPGEFAPYSSRYDDVLRDRAQLTASEARGLRLFDDPAKGNCASCHPSARAPDGAFPLFTDFGMVALGVPRNAGLRGNRDPSFADLGLCGPLRTDFATRDAYCGLFRTPTLRNVAVRASFFHNGVFHDLRDVLRFYASRDVQAGRFYPSDAGGTVRKFDDLPTRYRANVNVDPPFDRHPGDPPALTEAEIDDVIAFLCALTDIDVAAAAAPSCREQAARMQP
jgi:cytochrome c peroxidase